MLRLQVKFISVNFLLGGGGGDRKVRTYYDYVKSTVVPGCTSDTQRTARPDLEMALALLETHASKMNPLKALEILPDTVPIGRIKHFLEVSLQEKLNARRKTQVLKGLLYAEHLQVQEQRMHYESQSVLMTEFNICPVCKKRFGNQRFVFTYI